MSLSTTEKNLVDLLVGMVAQNCADQKDSSLYDSGCISIHRDALRYLVKLGLMECVYPEEDAEDYPWRWYHAKFVANWERKLWEEL